jgi:hypothetical protein
MCNAKKVFSGFCQKIGGIMLIALVTLISCSSNNSDNSDNAGYFSEGLTPVKLNNKWGFIDKTGKEVIPIKYDNAGYFSEGLAPVKLNGKCGFIDKTGKEVIPIKYDNVSKIFLYELDDEIFNIDNETK